MAKLPKKKENKGTVRNSWKKAEIAGVRNRERELPILVVQKGLFVFLFLVYTVQLNAQTSRICYIFAELADILQ